MILAERVRWIELKNESRDASRVKQRSTDGSLDPWDQPRAAMIKNGDKRQQHINGRRQIGGGVAVYGSMSTRKASTFDLNTSQNIP